LYITETDMMLDNVGLAWCELSQPQSLFFRASVYMRRVQKRRYLVHLLSRT